MIKQPGALLGAFYRSIEEDSPLQFVNFARWERPDAVAKTLCVTAKECKRQRLDVMADMKGPGVRIFLNNYVKEVRY